MSENSYDLPHFSTDLSGQVALVTGTTAGLGQRFARVLASCGAAVALTGRRVERLEALEKELNDTGATCASFPLDMTDRASVAGIVADVEARLGPVTILVNNAGIPDAQRAHKMSPELVDAVFETNLRGPWDLSCAVARRLIELEKPGRIVNISSVAAYSYGGNGAALYSVTKAAVVRMTEALAVEWARNHINVNGIAPGAFESEMMDGMLQRVGDIAKHFPRKRIGNPAQLDSTLLYLVSPASDAVTGTVIKVDDGQGTR